MIDPVIRAAMIGAISIILLAGAWSKARALQSWLDAVAGYRLVPEGWVRSVGLLILTTELAGGLLLLSAHAGSSGAELTFGLVAIATGAVSINLLRGRRDIQCGCGGIGADQRLSWRLVIRNFILLACIYGTTLTLVAREVTILDRCVAAAAAIGAAGLYAAANQMLAIQPRLDALRRSS